MAEQVSRLPPLPDPLPAAVQELFAERIKRSGAFSISITPSVTLPS
jgi:hypothetical protein